MKYLIEKFSSINMRKLLCLWCNDPNFWKIIEKYTKIGYKVYYEKCENALIVLTNEFIYSIRVFKIHGKLYWKLCPYNNSYFQTELTKDHCNIDIVLFAITEHEKFFLEK